MATKIGALAALLIALSLSGCVTGLIYQDTTEPLTTRMHASPMSIDKLKASAVTIREPFSVIRASASWSSYGFGAAMKDDREEPVCLADHRIQSVLLGIWRRDTLIAYKCPAPDGDAKDPKKAG